MTKLGPTLSLAVTEAVTPLTVGVGNNATGRGPSREWGNCITDLSVSALLLWPFHNRGLLSCQQNLFWPGGLPVCDQMLYHLFRLNLCMVG